MAPKGYVKHRCGVPRCTDTPADPCLSTEELHKAVGLSIPCWGTIRGYTSSMKMEAIVEPKNRKYNIKLNNKPSFAGCETCMQCKVFVISFLYLCDSSIRWLVFTTSFYWIVALVFVFTAAAPRWTHPQLSCTQGGLCMPSTPAQMKGTEQISWGKPFVTYAHIRLVYSPKIRKLLRLDIIQLLIEQCINKYKDMAFGAFRILILWRTLSSLVGSMANTEEPPIWATMSSWKVGHVCTNLWQCSNYRSWLGLATWLWRHLLDWDVTQLLK